MKSRIFFVILCLLFVGSVNPLAADETWQGNAAVSMRGELDRDGYYAASNSFPPGTKILVTNLANGKSVVVTVRQRLNGTTNVFLLLSSRASMELGMNPTDIARIKTQVVGLSTDLTGGVTEFAYNRDTDTNPAYGTPDQDKTVTAETTPSPTPTPFVDRTVIETAKTDIEKERFATPFTEQEADVSQRRVVAKDDRETLGDVELKEARVPVKEKGQAILIIRPKAPESAESVATRNPDLPKVAERDVVTTDVYRPYHPDREEVVAILLDPKELSKEEIVTEEGSVTVVKRPSMDRETVVAALNDPVLQETDRPFVWELHDVKPAGEELALAEPILPEPGATELASVDTYVKNVQDKDRVALENYILPEVEKGGQADVTTMARTEPEKDTVTVRSFELPEAIEREKPDILDRAHVSGRDKKEEDLALLPSDPTPVKKPKQERTIITVVPDNTETAKVEPDNTETAKVEQDKPPVWDTGTDYTRNFYYLQLGVFTERATAEKIIRANPTYPMLIVSGKAGSSNVYKVVVGPLKRDETGTVLYLFKARGYRDAFLRYIE